VELARDLRDSTQQLKQSSTFRWPVKHD